MIGVGWFSKNWIKDRGKRNATKGGMRCYLEKEIDSLPYRSA
jgi:hypothetical protein